MDRTDSLISGLISFSLARHHLVRLGGRGGRNMRSGRVCAKWWRPILTRTVRLVAISFLFFYFFFPLFTRLVGSCTTKRDCVWLSSSHHHHHRRCHPGLNTRRAKGWADFKVSQALLLPLFSTRLLLLCPSQLSWLSDAANSNPLPPFTWLSSSSSSLPSLFVVGGGGRCLLADRPEFLFFFSLPCFMKGLRLPPRPSHSSTRYSFPRSSPDNDSQRRRRLGLLLPLDFHRS
jgi:hypothetical protein